MVMIVRLLLKLISNRIRLPSTIHQVNRGPETPQSNTRAQPTMVAISGALPARGKSGNASFSVNASEAKPTIIASKLPIVHVWRARSLAGPFPFAVRLVNFAVATRFCEGPRDCSFHVLCPCEGIQRRLVAALANITADYIAALCTELRATALRRCARCSRTIPC